MAKFEISEAADRDLSEIYAYSFRQYGEQQADLYLSALHDRFQQLALRQSQGRNAEDLRPGYRRSRCASYVIFFVAAPDGIRIIRVLHGKMDPVRHL